jgi:ApaG protein
MTRISKSNKFHESLDSSSTYKKSYSETTGNFQVTVWPEFIDSRLTEKGSIFIWAYHVCIENRSAESAQLTKRHWRIIDEKGDLEEVEGEGVVGEQPMIAPGSSYQYSSGVHLHNPSGIMSGKYFMTQPSNSNALEIKIPTFSLDVPNLKKVIN